MSRKTTEFAVHSLDRQRIMLEALEAYISAEPLKWKRRQAERIACRLRFVLAVPRRRRKMHHSATASTSISA